MAAQRSRKDDFYYRFRRGGLSSAAVDALWSEIQRLRTDAGLPSEEPTEQEGDSEA